MKSFNSSGNSPLKRKPNFWLMLLAVLVASGLWWYVSLKDMVEAEIDINLDYTDIPPDLIVMSGLVNKMAVRLRGPEALVRPLSKETISYGVPLDKIKKGETIIPLGSERMNEKFRAFHIIDIEPTRLLVVADTLVEKVVRVTTEEEQPFNNETLKVENVRTNPGTVILKGPQSIVSQYNDIKLLYRPDPKITGKEQEQTLILDTPNFVTAIPTSVKITFTITSERKKITREYPILLSGSVEDHYEVMPEQVTITAEVPEALSKNIQYLNQFEVSVVPPPMALGEIKKVKLNFHIPEGFKILQQSVTEATVKKLVNE